METEYDWATVVASIEPEEEHVEYEFTGREFKRSDADD